VAEILFYHLTQTPLEQALPPMLQRSLERGWRVRVRGVDAERLDWLDRFLWTYEGAGFLPHGRAGGEHDAHQPILLSEHAQNSNEATVLFMIDGAEETDLAAYERVCLVFDGNDSEAVQGARGQWGAFKGAGYACKYWAQEGGRWVEKA